MSKAVKSKIYQVPEGLEDKVLLAQVMEEIAFNTIKNDITDTLNAEKVNELYKAIGEADNKETIDWEDFKKEMNEWREK
jgi:hypothetical protein